MGVGAGWQVRDVLARVLRQGGVEDFLWPPERSRHEREHRPRALRRYQPEPCRITAAGPRTSPRVTVATHTASFASSFSSITTAAASLTHTGGRDSQTEPDRVEGS